jgi:glutamate 5-kinase
MKMSIRRIVVKFGTGLLTSGGDQLDLEIMHHLVRQVAALHNCGQEMLIVSSGAIAAGRQRLKESSGYKNVSFKQVMASVGQSHLMYTYERLFSQKGITIAQALLTKSDIAERAGYLNARNTLLALIDLRIICIINENDVVAFDEIEEYRFGDNDNLSAMVANLVDADLLVLLTDTPGLYTADPHVKPEARLIHRVDKIDENIECLAGNTTSSQGTGGMVTKIEAAKLATSSGVNVIIADGREGDILLKIKNGEEVGTFFPAQVDKMESRKRWMLSGLASRGKVVVDNGAASAIKKYNKSLLPAGVLQVYGDFQRGEVVDVIDQKGEQIACGISNYNSKESTIIMKEHSWRILSLLGHEYGDELIHRNNMVVIYRDDSSVREKK